MRVPGGRFGVRFAQPVVSTGVVLASPPVSKTFPFESARQTASALTERLGGPFAAAVVWGTGWGEATTALGEELAAVGYDDLPHVPVPGVGGHAGRAVAVALADGQRVLVLEGRSHLYEGRTANEVAHAVRSAVLAGAATVVLTNAAGGINPLYRVGQGVLIADHINVTAQSSLTGPLPPPDLPGRFVDLTDLYSARLRAAARQVDSTLSEGVYVGLVGPHFETPAEIRLFAGWGADLVGMSTVLEAIAARHLGAEVLGLSLVTNVAAGLPGADLSHDAVLSAARASAAALGALLSKVLVAAAQGTAK